MKKTSIVLACALALAFVPGDGAAGTITLAYGDPSTFVGVVIPGNGGQADELSFIANLITVPAGETDSTLGDGQVYDRTDSELETLIPVGGVYTKIEPITFDEEDEIPLYSVPVDFVGTFYVLAKYDAHNAGSLVWLVTVTPEDTAIELPEKYDGQGLSHVTMLVPDGGMTLILLGGALIGLGALGRKFLR